MNKPDWNELPPAVRDLWVEAARERRRAEETDRPWPGWSRMARVAGIGLLLVAGLVLLPFVLIAMASSPAAPRDWV